MPGTRLRDLRSAGRGSRRGRRRAFPIIPANALSARPISLPVSKEENSSQTEEKIPPEEKVDKKEIPLSSNKKEQQLVVPKESTNMQQVLAAFHAFAHRLEARMRVIEDKQASLAAPPATKVYLKGHRIKHFFAINVKSGRQASREILKHEDFDGFTRDKNNLEDEDIPWLRKKSLEDKVVPWLQNLKSIFC